jgi:hypothetical protein
MLVKDAFKIMEEFVKTVDNNELSEKLLGALDNKQPFKNYKLLIERSEEYRQKWFDFRSKEYKIWVRNYLNQLSLT